MEGSVDVLFFRGLARRAEDIQFVDRDSPVEIGALLEEYLELSHSLSLALEYVHIKS